jgi:hypothetical protein
MSALKMLLFARASVNTKDKFVVPMLSCCDSDLRSRWSRTPISVASANGHVDVVEALIVNRAVVDEKDK